VKTVRAAKRGARSCLEFLCGIVILITATLRARCEDGFRANEQQGSVL
jgi:hypothetical protein